MLLRWTQTARKDRLAIIRYISQDNPDAARHLNDLLGKAASSLLNFPFRGRVGLVEGTRELVAHPSYILVYRASQDVIYILSVLHTSRQYPSE